MSHQGPSARSGRPDAEAGPPSSSGLTRRDFVALGTGVFVLLSLPRAVQGRRRRLVRRTVPAMGTFAELAVPAEDRRSAQTAIDAAIAELAAVEAGLTRFRPDSDVGRANLARPGTRVAVSPETATSLATALSWARATEGRFDPCLARAIALWNVGSRTEPPPPAAVRRFSERSLYRALEIESTGEPPAIRLHHPDAGLDLGGIGKGMGVDRAVAALRALGVRDALVNLGGDLFAMGRSEDGDRWEIGVRSATNPARLATTLRITDEAVATSGDYVHYFEHRGRRYHHLLDPRTGAPGRSAWRSLTVTAPSCTAADAAATALFGLDPTAGRRRLASWEPRARLIHAG